MPEPNNRDRAEWAREALDGFIAETGNASGTTDEHVSDLLCDLRHLCDAEGVEWAAMIRRANMHYRAEIEELGQLQSRCKT